MLVIQQNCGKGYECTISALEAGLGLDAAVVCIQEPFLGSRSISHSVFNLYWPSGTDNRKDMRVLTAVREDILDNVIIENRTDLVSHPYCMVLDIKERNPVSGNYSRKTRVVIFMIIRMATDVYGKGPALQYDEPFRIFPGDL